MIIHEFFYNEDNDTLYVEFSTIDDGDDFYRSIELDFDTIEYYSPTIITEYDIPDIDEEQIIDVIKEYLKDNDLPEQLSL